MDANLAQYAAAAVVGLLGGVHCVGMCGGIVGVLTLGLPAETRARATRLLPYLVAYNAGRLASYTLIGALAGGVGAYAAHLVSVRHAQLGLQLIAGGFMVVLGLYLAGVWAGITRIERAGGGLWRLAGLVLSRPPVLWLARPVYALVAANRHRLPGGTATCRLDGP